ncbi:MAG: antitoxin family protein [Planctomycetes bacterium]|nr:antitoxin family protein [Planctomycetota bacterium]
MGTIHAIYENGVFKPKGPVSVPEGCEVEFEPRVVEAPDILKRELAWVESLKNRTDAEIEEARRRLFALSRPPAPIPEGKTLSDMVEGKWPGDETDEQINEALKRLS